MPVGAGEEHEPLLLARCRARSRSLGLVQPLERPARELQPWRPLADHWVNVSQTLGGVTELYYPCLWTVLSTMS